MACALMAVASSAALADRHPQPDPSALWQAYPLEQKPTTVAKAPAAGGAPQRPGGSAKGRAPASSADKPSSDPPLALIAALVAAAGLLVLAAIAVRRRRRQPAAAGLVFPGASPRAAPVVSAPRPGPVSPAPRPAPVPPAPHAAPFTATPAQRPLEPAPPLLPAAPPRDGRRTAAARKSVTCQVRWNRRGRSFYAVSVDDNGIEHMLVSSPRLEAAGPAPPDETPDARAAIRHLAKELRDRGWRPLRAKGIDFDERRWYARRFRWPTEEEVAEAGHAETREVDEHVSGRPAGGR